MNHDVFISYKRKDFDIVNKIKQEIESNAKVSCWIDLDGIETDAQFVNVIMRAIKDCDIFLFMYSKRHLEITDFDNDWTAKEINFAQKKNKRIIFVNIDNTPLSDYFEFSFGLKQQIDYNDPRYRKRLYEDLRKWCVKGEVPEKDEPNKENSNKINGHEFVDLGLPSGLKWATCNIGANRPEEYGNYYLWGETSTKSSYTEDNSKTYGKNMGDISGNASYDAARANWGSTWRLPTEAEFEELLNKCTWMWTTQGGKNGYKITGPNGNSIFLPAAGYRYGTSLYNVGEYGGCWSSTPNESNTLSAYYLNFNSGNHYTTWYYRYYGRSVRPVSE